MPVHLVFALFPLCPLSMSVPSVEGQTSTLLIRLAARRLGQEMLSMHLPGTSPVISLGGSRSYVVVVVAGQAGAYLHPS